MARLALLSFVALGTVNRSGKAVLARVHLQVSGVKVPVC